MNVPFLDTHELNRAKEYGIKESERCGTDGHERRETGGPERVATVSDDREGVR
jgi:hypothetical protein